MILVIFLAVWKVFGADPIKVTIVGDSITCCTPDGDHAYPKLLQSLAGDVYEISSYGVGGTSAMTSDHIDPEWQSYQDTKEYQLALESKW
ncbi:hypothetical protein FACS189472_18980 [Alphaproteobacteria bacterium]|nr:hypothetical protein FACS189472_18980 [Alphaproteobacteria bacterium]